ncbi:MAG: hypothetical protein GKR94_31095 [Gammaproteobacteria bacterium]|nr:hypothetical protein [Gammaproteobacteria bacterium]
MTPRVELILTIAVCALGLGYFTWKAWIATDKEQLTYTALVIVGAVFAHRAVKDVLDRLRGREGDENVAEDKDA